MSHSKRRKRDKEMLRKPRIRTIRSLNDLYVLIGLMSQALEEMQELAANEPDEIEFEAPSSNQESTIVTRDAKELSRLLQKARDRSIYEQFLISAAALTEDYLQSTLKVAFDWFPEKLAFNVEGKDIEKNVPLNTVLKATSIDEILDSVIRRKLLLVFYGSPERYFDYVQSVLSIEIENELKESFAEVKAARDIIIHNSGIANEVYLLKARKKARADIGEHLPIDEAYFKSTIQMMKKLTMSVYSKTKKKLL